MGNKIEIENKIKNLEAQLKDKLLERGEIINDGGWHDNAAVDSINAEIYVLENRLDILKQKLSKLK
jgi:hypothetical protein